MGDLGFQSPPRSLVPSASLYPDPYSPSRLPTSSSSSSSSYSSSSLPPSAAPASPYVFQQLPSLSSPSATQGGFNSPYSPGVSAMMRSPTSPFTASTGTGAPIEGSISSTTADLMQIVLQNAAAQLDARLNTDSAYPELTILVQPGGSTGDYLTLEHEPRFAHKKRIVLPDALFEQYNQLECKCFMGLFPQINRAWLTIDEKLFLWNYTDGSDFYIFDQLDQIIVSVALTTPKRGVFIDDIKHLLVVATPIEIILLGVAVSPNGRGDLTLIPTQLAVPSDNINMLSIVGTSNGRIFMGAKDGHLYELIYQAEEGWFTRKCRKANLTYSPLSNLIPGFLFSSEDPIFSLAFDESRNFLYTLSEKNVIQLFHLGADGMGFVHVAKNATIIEELRRQSIHVDQKSFRIIAIHPIRQLESAHVHLVAITSLGERIFFVANKFGAVPPKGLDVLSVRKAPPVNTGADAGFGRPHVVANVHTAHYMNGTLILANAVSEEADDVIAVRPNSSEVFRRKVLSEIATHIGVEGKIWAIEESPANSSHLIYNLPTPLPSYYLQNELATQYHLPPKEFFCLTNAGIHILAQLRPVDYLRQLISESGGQSTPQLKAFFNRYSKDEACSMCLYLATQSGPASNGYQRSQLNPLEHRVTQWATYIFFHMNEEPQARSRFAGSYETGADMGFPVASPELNLSSAHNGFVLYFGRLIAPLWKQQIAASKGPVSKFVPRDLLATSFDNLLGLKEFLDRNPNFTAPPRPWDLSQRFPDRSMAMSRGGDDVARAEQQSLSGLQLLLNHSLEAIAFLLLIHDHNFGDIFKALSAQAQRELSSLNFASLVATHKGKDVCKDLVAILLNKYIMETANIDAVTEVLRQRCPSFLGPNDALLFKASEFLQRAKEAPSEREGLLRDSLRVFLKVTKTISSEKLIAVCEDFQTLHFFSGVFDLAFACAQECDPLGQALQYYRDRCPDMDPRAEFYTKRTQCYDRVFNAVEYLNAIIKEGGKPAIGTHPALSAKQAQEIKTRIFQSISASKDEVFHISFYTWLLTVNQSQTILDIRTPYIEDFLVLKASDTRSPDKDLLWKYYIKNSMFVEAAQYLSSLAESDDDRFTFQTRLEYLSRALTCAKSVKSLSDLAVDSELLTDLEEKIEVAYIQQQIYSEIEKSAAFEEGIRQRALAELDSGLFDVTILYNKFARRYRLHEASLAIIYCSGYSDPLLVENIWREIIQQEHDTRNNSRFAESLKTKVTEIGKTYFPSEVVFPIGFLVLELERLSYEAQVERKEWVYETMLDVGVPFPHLFRIYNQIFNLRVAPWDDPLAKANLLTAIFFLLYRAIHENSRDFPAKEVEEAVSKYILMLETSPAGDPTQLLNSFKDLLRAIRQKF